MNMAWKERYAYVDSLPQGSPEFQHFIHDPSVQVRRRIVAPGLQYPGADVVEIMSSDPDPEVRVRVVNLLPQGPSLDRLALDPDKKVRAAAIEKLPGNSDIFAVAVRVYPDDTSLHYRVCRRTTSADPLITICLLRKNSAQESALRKIREEFPGFEEMATKALIMSGSLSNLWVLARGVAPDNPVLLELFERERRGAYALLQEIIAKRWAGDQTHLEKWATDKCYFVRMAALGNLSERAYPDLSERAYPDKPSQDGETSE